MTAQLSRERLEELKIFITAFLTDPAHDDESKNSLTADVFRLALAGMDSEPVAFVREGYGLCYFRPPREYGLKIGDNLYAAPPAPVAVPDDLLHMAADAIEDLLGNTDRSSSAAAWYDLPGKLRAAMQSFGNSEQLVSPRYKLTDGWISEAKNLADLHGLSFVVFRKGEEPQCADPSKVNISFTDEGLGYPAAPEQEV